MYPSTRREAHGNTRERDAEAHTQRDKTQADHLHTSNRVRPPLHPSSNSHTHTHHLPQPPRRPRLRVGRGDPPWGAEHVPERQLPYDLPRPGQPRLLLQRVGLSRGRLCHLHRDAVSAALNESIIVSYRCSQCTSMYLCYVLCGVRYVLNVYCGSILLLRIQTNLSLLFLKAPSTTCTSAARTAPTASRGPVGGDRM